MPSQPDNDSSCCVAVPAHNATEGLSFLESVAAGNIGGGVKMTGQGQTIPAIRTEYKLLIEKFELDLQRRMADGADSKTIAKWAVNERTRIARLMRVKQGGGAQLVLELRDNGDCQHSCRF